MSAYSENARNLGDLITRQADVRANAIQQRGQNIGNTLGNLGQLVAGLPQQMRQTRQLNLQEQRLQQQAEQERIQQEHQQALASIFQKHGGDLEKAIPEVMQFDPPLGMELQQRWQQAQKTAVELKNAALQGQSSEDEYVAKMIASSDPSDIEGWGQKMLTIKALGRDVSQYGSTPNPKVIKAANDSLMTAQQRDVRANPPAPEPFNLSPGQVRFGPDGQPIASVPAATPQAAPFNLSPGQTRFGPDGQPIASLPPTPDRPPTATPAQVGSFEDFVIRKYGPKPTSDQIATARKDWAASGQAPRSTEDTAQDRQRNARLDAARQFLGRLNELREKINTKMGPRAGLTGIVRRGQAAVGLDPDVAEYERERAAGGRALAVAIMGAQNLSDADASAWANMLPDARTDQQTAQRLTAQVERMLDNMNPPLQGATAGPLMSPPGQASPSTPATPATGRIGPFTFTVVEP